MLTYSISRNGQTFGPYSLEEVRRYVGGGSISPNDLARINGEHRWAPLHRLLPPPPAPPLESGLSSPPPPPLAARPIQRTVSLDHQPAEFWKTLFRATPTVYVTPAIIAANLIVYILMVGKGVSWIDPTIQNLLDWGADYGPLTTSGEWWRILTSTFVHIGIIHILMNMWVLYDIGKFTERLFGHFGLSVLYVLAGVGGSLASVACHPDTVSAGASGAIFGLYGGLLAFLLRQRHTVPAETLKSLARSTGTFLLYNVIYGFLRQGTDLAAHVGGLLTGFLIGLILSQSLQHASTGSRALRGVIAVLLGSVALAACAVEIPGTGERVVHLAEGNQSQDAATNPGQHVGGLLLGRISDASGAGIEGATVTLLDKDGNPLSRVSTDGGAYRFESVDAGSYTVKFSAPGFQESSVSAVTVEENRSTTLDQQLQPGESHSEDTVYTTAIRAILNGDDETSRPMKELIDRITQVPQQDFEARASAMRQLAAAASDYVAQAQRMDLSACPPEFAEAYRAHLKTWSDESEALNSFERNQADPNWANRIAALDDRISTTWKAVQSIAARYGAQ